MEESLPCIEPNSKQENKSYIVCHPSLSCCLMSPAGKEEVVVIALGRDLQGLNSFCPCLLWPPIHALSPLDLGRGSRGTRDEGAGEGGDLGGWAPRTCQGVGDRGHLRLLWGGGQRGNDAVRSKRVSTLGRWRQPLWSYQMHIRNSWRREDRRRCHNLVDEDMEGDLGGKEGGPGYWKEKKVRQGTKWGDLFRRNRW